MSNEIKGKCATVYEPIEQEQWRTQGACKHDGWGSWTLSTQRGPEPLVGVGTKCPKTRVYSGATRSFAYLITSVVFNFVHIFWISCILCRNARRNGAWRQWWPSSTDKGERLAARSAVRHWFTDSALYISSCVNTDRKHSSIAPACFSRGIEETRQWDFWGVQEMLLLTTCVVPIEQSARCVRLFRQTIKYTWPRYLSWHADSPSNCLWMSRSYVKFAVIGGKMSLKWSLWSWVTAFCFNMLP